jgi:hypothetical protein
MNRIVILALGLVICARADVNVLKTVHFVMKDGVVFKSSTGERVP